MDARLRQGPTDIEQARFRRDPITWIDIALAVAVVGLCAAVAVTILFAALTGEASPW